MVETHYGRKGFLIPDKWEELTQMKDFLVTYGGETRKKEDQVRYDDYLEQTPRDRVLAGIRSQLNGFDAALVKNNYPYSLVLQNLPHVGHYLIWSKKGELEEEEVERIVTSEFPENEWFSFVTAPTNKSVPEIWHAHVFVNHKSNSTT